MANSKRLCTGCKVRYPTDELKSHPVGNFHSDECAIAYGQKNGAKARIKAKDKEFKEIKKRVRSRSEKSRALETTQNIFNKFIRLRDKGDVCISCQKPPRKKNAGHFLSRGAFPELRYEELNCHLQCEHCNSFKAGNQLHYRKYLIDKIGIEKVEWLEGPHEPKRYTVDELKQLQKHYSQLIRELEE